VSMKKRNSFAALALGLTLIAAACGSDDNKTSNSTATTAAAPTTAAATATTAGSTGGGTVRIGVEQEWNTMDWMASDAGSTYGSWSGQYFTTARPYDFVKGADGIWAYKTSNLLSGDPTLSTVGDKQTVTYKINPDAVWNDGKPITSTDFKYTWDQVANQDKIYDKSVFRDVSGVDDSDPATAVVTYSTANASWQDLYEAYGLYPAHLLEGKDRNALTKDGYTWSAGPFQLVKWDKGVGATFEKNPMYWGEQAKIDKIEETFFADTAAEFQAFKAGEVDTIGPQPQLDAIDAINAGGLPGTSSVDGETGNVEALWINNAAPPFDDVAVRQAVAYSIDRDAIVNKLFGGIGVTTAVQSLNPPILAAFSDQKAFSGYKLDLDKVTSIMTDAGYAKGSDGFWAKGGKKVSFTLKSTAGNKRRELTEQVMQQQLKEAGFDMTIVEEKADDLFGTSLPGGDYQIALYAQTATTLNPSLSSLFLSKNIPQPPENSGTNWTRTDIADLDPLLVTVDTETDTTKRADAAKKADDLMAEQVVSIPLDPLPNIGFYGDNISGDFSTNVVLGPWWNINTWTVNS
jgi:peptide/nickel transport system substrate-binding protein